MNEDTKRQKIRQFMNDPLMSEAVYEVISEKFLEDSDARDVELLAAERVAINLLRSSWKKMERYKAQEEVTKKETTQIGL